MDQIVESRLVTFAAVWVAMTASLACEASILEGELQSPSSIAALLSKDHSITIELGVEYSHPSIPSISNVVVENPSTSTVVTPRLGSVDNNYPDTLAQTLRVQMLLNPKNRFTVAAKTFLPLDGLAQMDTGNIYQPELALYRAESQRPRILLTSGMNLSPRFRVGLGLDIGFSVDSVATIFLQSGAGTVSDQRVSAKVRPSLIPQASLALDSYSLTYRGENKASFDLSTQAGARIFSSTSAGVDFKYTTNSALFFEPMSFEFEGKQEITRLFTLHYGASYEFWSRYQSRAAVIQGAIPVNCNNNTGCNSTFSSGVSPQFTARDLLVPEGALDFAWGDDSVQLGYRFKDSIFTDVPKGVGNYLDPPRHDFRLAYAHPTAGGWEWRIHAGVSRLVAQNVVKSDPNSIGGPSYQVSGWLYGGGLSVAIPFKN